MMMEEALKEMEENGGEFDEDNIPPPPPAFMEMFGMGGMPPGGMGGLGMDDIDPEVMKEQHNCRVASFLAAVVPVDRLCTASVAPTLRIHC